MAGGIGSRLWPLSRKECPKQFVDILGVGKTFIQMTYERFARFIPVENFLVVTGEMYKELALEQLPMLSEKQILTEPCRRNTAPCVAYAMYKLRSMNPDAVAVITPSDQYIGNVDGFEDMMLKNLRFAAAGDALLTVGVTPSFPATGYGYIQTRENGGGGISNVMCFREKPDLMTATRYLSQGDFYWNSGMFIWSVSAITKAFERYLPEVADLFESISPVYGDENEQVTVNAAYEKSPNISIDYGVMEKAENVFVYCSSDLAWSDVGSWGALYTLSDHDTNGNAVGEGRVFCQDSRNLLVKELNPGKQVVIDGLEGYLIADTKDVLLICPNRDEGYVKSLIDRFIS